MSAIPQPRSSIEVFFSYSHDDEELREKLDNHLSAVWRSGVAVKWYDRQIGAGREWSGQIDEHLSTADIILLLISPDFLASDYCYDVEMKRALERHERGEAHVIPILLRPVHLPRSGIGKLQYLPRNGKAVTSWDDADEALAAIATEIAEVVDDLLDRRELPPIARPVAKGWRIPWWLLVLFVATVIAGLIVLGIRARQPRLPETPIVTTGPADDRVKHAFAAGSAVAMAGQSTDDTGAAVFREALAGLGIRRPELEQAYAATARAAESTYDDFEDAKVQLLRKVHEPMPREHAQAVVFGHDVTAFLLLLRAWPQLESEDERARMAQERVTRVQRSVDGTGLPAPLVERIRMLDANKLQSAEERQKSEELLLETLHHFDRPRERKRG